MGKYSEAGKTWFLPNLHVWGLLQASGNAGEQRRWGRGWQQRPIIGAGTPLSIRLTLGHH